MILVGDEAPHEAQSTDGISLLEGRWVLSCCLHSGI
jgi:hypothetical protein